MPFKRQNDWKMRRVFSWLSTFCMSFPYLCPILAQTIRLHKDNSKIINSIFFFQRVCVYERRLEVKISGISCKLKATYVFVYGPPSWMFLYGSQKFLHDITYTPVILSILNVYIKFGQIMSINSQYIEGKRNSNINQGPQLISKFAKNDA